MADRPILFSGPMVRALLAGRKTQTRRVLRNIEHTQGDQYHVWGNGGGCCGVHEIDVPAVAPDYVTYEPGDRLYVREAWRADDFAPEDASQTIFRADAPLDVLAETRGVIRWKPGIHMHRARSRLTLIVADVRVQRLQEISEADALAEGVELGSDNATSPNHAFAFQCLWDSLNADRGYGWDENPWVIAISFTVHQVNIDAMEAPNAS